MSACYIQLIEWMWPFFPVFLGFFYRSAECIFGYDGCWQKLFFPVFSFCFYIWCLHIMIGSASKLVFPSAHVYIWWQINLYGSLSLNESRWLLVSFGMTWESESMWRYLHYKGTCVWTLWYRLSCTVCLPLGIRTLWSYSVLQLAQTLSLKFGFLDSFFLLLFISGSPMLKVVNRAKKIRWISKTDARVKN